MNVTTRPPTEADRPFARAAYHAAYRDVVRAQFGAWVEAEQDEFFDSKWPHPGFRMLLAEDRPCGFVIVEDDTDEVRLVELVIHPERQGRGIGTAFLAELIGNTDQTVRLEVLLRNRAFQLYRKLGFTECGRTDTHIQMERRKARPAP